ncbi:hypothetical protein AK812_SmicGene32914 [Symbiodinium microadriaticum]|uniref:Transmembrane protein n=1 Tax=Symbiodinium microadriaticum TaxID=2951 RepID=A0A1Q9CSW1_SYMMI|nr:hypothetical protein AK812_SmicGene32914 [Symbiodinium microadriaticum]
MPGERLPSEPVAASERITNLLTVVDDALRAAIQPQTGNTVANPLGAVAAPAAVLLSVMAGTVLGAVSYRRSARRLTRVLAPEVSSPVPQAGKPPVTGVPTPTRAPRATDFLSKGEIVYLFAVPGLFALSLAGLLGMLGHWALGARSVEEAVRRLKWLLGNGSRPATLEPPSSSGDVALSSLWFSSTLQLGGWAVMAGVRELGFLLAASFLALLLCPWLARLQRDQFYWHSASEKRWHPCRVLQFYQAQIWGSHLARWSSFILRAMEWFPWASMHAQCGKPLCMDTHRVEAVGPSLVTQLPKQDRRGVWRDYNPDSDDYDPRSAPLLPPPEDPHKEIRRQASALRGRIKRGGSEKVLAHYKMVLEELERSMAPVPTWPRKALAGHKRSPSTTSTLTESTQMPDEEMDEVDDLLEDSDDLEIPEEALEVAVAQSFAKKALPSGMRPRRPIPVYQVCQAPQRASRAPAKEADPLIFQPL